MFHASRFCDSNLPTFPAPPQPFKALMPNLRGSDFFVGDIHGGFTRLSRDLESRGFDPSKDRLICVGDLVDRGEDCDVASQWLEQPFFHAVRGNHEDLYLRWRALGGKGRARQEFEKESYFKNGGRWVRSLDEAEHRKLEGLLSQLPYFIAVAAPDGRTVGVVHAELPDGCSWPKMLQLSECPELLKSMTWGRKRLKAARRGEPEGEDGNRIRGLDALACGHVVVRQPTVLGNIIYLDTGGWNPKGRFSLLRIEELLGMVDSAKTTS